LATDGFALGVPEVRRWVDKAGRDQVTLSFGGGDDGSPVEINSPGGSTVATFPAPVWRVLASPRSLVGQGFVVFFGILAQDPTAFAESSAFGGWNHAWLGVLGTLAVEANVVYSVDRNAQGVIMTFLAALWGRYTRGMEHAQSVSHSSAAFWSRLVNLFVSGTSAVTRDAAMGRLGLVQHDEFRVRLQEIQLAFGKVLAVLRTYGVFSPAAVSSLQSVLPISVVHSDGVLNYGVRKPKALPRHKRGNSARELRDWGDRVEVLPNVRVRERGGQSPVESVAGTGLSARGYAVE